MTKENYQESSYETRFTQTEYGTTIDHKTNIEWSLEDIKGTWEEVVEIASKKGDGWRIPTCKELFSIVDESTFNPASYPELCIQSDCYWSSTTDADFKRYAWAVSFNHGFVGSSDKTRAYYVRCVREFTDHI
jgi:hypothetical protein